MQFAPVMPLKSLIQLDTGHYHLVQSFDIAKQGGSVLGTLISWGMVGLGHWTILDNGAYEEGINFPQLVEVAKMIRPDEIVCPDVVEDKATTLDLMYEHSEELVSLVKTRVTRAIMVVPQGRSLAEWIDCMWAMISHFTAKYAMHPNMGMPKYLDMGLAINRLGVVSYLADKGIDLLRVHLLGTYDSFMEFVRVARVFPQVRGCDSTFPYAAAEKLHIYDGGHGAKYRIDHWDQTLTWARQIIAEYNIAVCRAALANSQLWPMPISG